MRWPQFIGLCIMLAAIIGVLGIINLRLLNIQMNVSRINDNIIWQGQNK